MQRNNLIKLGKYVNTHGIKGEIRILSKFPHDEELQPGNKVLIKDQEFTINGFRKHKNFTLITFEGINNINDIEYLKGQFVYGESQSEEPYIPEYIGFEIVLNDEVVGEVTDYFLQGSTWSLVVKLNDGRTTNIPMVEEEFIDSITENQIKIKDIGLI